MAPDHVFAEMGRAAQTTAGVLRVRGWLGPAQDGSAALVIRGAPVRSEVCPVGMDRLFGNDEPCCCIGFISTPGAGRCGATCPMPTSCIQPCAEPSQAQMKSVRPVNSSGDLNGKPGQITCLVCWYRAGHSPIGPESTCPTGLPVWSLQSTWTSDSNSTLSSPVNAFDSGCARIRRLPATTSGSVCSD